MHNRVNKMVTIKEISKCYHEDLSLVHHELSHSSVYNPEAPIPGISKDYVVTHRLL